jgi:hypothetical protein
MSDHSPAEKLKHFPVESARVLRKRTGLLADFAPEQRLLCSKQPKSWIRTAACSLQARAAAVIAVITGCVSGVKSADLVFKHPDLFMKLCILRSKFRALRLKVAVLTLKFRVLSLDEPQVLTNDRRRAVLVDQLFKRLEQSHRVFLIEMDRTAILAPKAQEHKEMSK